MLSSFLSVKDTFILALCILHCLKTKLQLLVKQRKMVPVSILIHKISAFLIDPYSCLFRFRRMTGRNEVTVSPRDYKFYAPRHKYRRASNSISNITGFSVSFNDVLVVICNYASFFQFICLENWLVFFSAHVYQAFTSTDNASSFAAGQSYRSVSEVSIFSFSTS